MDPKLDNKDAPSSTSTQLHDPNSEQQGWKRAPSKWSSYRIGIATCALCSFVVLIINVAVTTSSLKKYDVDELGIGTLSKGNCAGTKKADMLIHLVINTLSTILLAATNYCMQCTNSPTRSQVDKAHSQRRWAYIGVMHFGNLRWVGTWKSLLCITLALSSVPLHLLWNSAVFSSVTANDYGVQYISEHSIQLLFNKTTPEKAGFERLGVEECIKAYAVQLVTDRGMVVVLTNATKTTLLDVTEPPATQAPSAYYVRAIEAGTPGGQPFRWICDAYSLNSGSCTAAAILKEYHRSGTWTFQGSAVQYCLSQKLREVCSLQFSKTIMMVIIACNIVKLIDMLVLLGLVYFNKEEPLFTIGDAISSFMERLDSSTKGICLFSEDDVAKKWRKPADSAGSVSLCPPLRKRCWYNAVGKRAFIIYIPPLLGLAAAVVLLKLGETHLRAASINILSLSFGAIDVRALAKLDGLIDSSNFILMALIANTPQLILSTSYLMYNRLYTSMLLSSEYDSYSTKAKPLRVSRPRGRQISRYFLSLPCRWSLPLIIASLLLHWLFSQSFFLVNIDIIHTPHITGRYVYSEDEGGKIDIYFAGKSGHYRDCGYSPTAIVCSISISILVLIAGLLVAFTRKYSGMIPLAGSNSVAISAACHRPEGDEDGHLRDVKWGEVLETAGRDVGHCAFTSTGTVGVRVNRRYY